LIGTGIGNVVLNNYENRKRETVGMVVPIVSSKGDGAAFQMNFKTAGAGPRDPGPEPT